MMRKSKGGKAAEQTNTTKYGSEEIEKGTGGLIE